MKEIFSDGNNKPKSIIKCYACGQENQVLFHKHITLMTMTDGEEGQAPCAMKARFKNKKRRKEKKRNFTCYIKIVGKLAELERWVNL